jgi:hypothetical protein
MPTHSVTRLREQDDPVLAIALGLAIPGSRPRLYSEDGTNDFTKESVSIAEAYASGRAFAIAVRDAVIGIDVDPDAAYGIRGAVAAALASCVDEEIPYIHNTSGRPGHEHVFIVLPSKTRPDLFQRRLTDEFGVPPIQIRFTKRGKFMRPPLTPHRNGTQTELIHPATIEEAVEIARVRPVLSEPSQAILDVEQYAVATPNRSNLIAGFMTGAINSNVPFEVVRTVLLADQGPLGTKIRERDYDDVERQWRNFQDFVTEHPGKRPGYVKREVGRIREIACAFDGWHPQTLHNDRVALETLLLKAVACGSVTFTAAIRTLALSAGMRKATLLESIGRLETLSFVEVFIQGEGSTRYRVRSPILTPSTSMDLSLDRGRRRLYWYQVDAGHDAFAPSALGKQGWLILSCMPRDGADAAEVAHACGYLRVHSTLRHLRKMSQFGVVECDAEGLWHPAEPMELDRAAELANSVGYIAAMRDRYAKDRAEIDEKRPGFRQGWRRSA